MTNLEPKKMDEMMLKGAKACLESDTLFPGEIPLFRHILWQEQLIEQIKSMIHASAIRNHVDKFYRVSDEMNALLTKIKELEDG